MVTRCVECDEPIGKREVAHAAHEATCDVDPSSEDWSCRCDAYAHKGCCRACKPPVVIEGQVSLLPEASTSRLPKRAHA